MKTIYFKFYPAVFLFFVSVITAQSDFNIAIQRENHKADNDLILLDNNLYFIETENSSMFSTIFVSSYSKAGLRRFETPVSGGGLLKSARLILSNDKQLILFFHSVECHLPSITKNRMVKLDTNGTVLASYTYAINNAADFGFESACKNDDGSYTAMSKQKLYHLSASGNSTTLLESFDSLTCITNAGADNVILSGTYPLTLPAGRHLILFNRLTWNLTKAYKDSSIYIKLLKNNTSWYGLTNQGRINRIDTNLQITGNSDLMQNYSGGNRISDFIIKNDSIIAGGYNLGTKSSFMLRADTNFISLTLSSDLNAGLIPAAIAQSSSHVYGLHNNRETGSNFIGKALNTTLTSYPLSLNFPYSKDAAIGSVTSTVTFTNGTCSYSGFLNVRIINKGQTVIDSLQLNTLSYGCLGACYPNMFFQKFKNLNILPNDSVTVQTNQFDFGQYGVHCLTLTRIDGEQDEYIDDNIKCVNFLATNLIEQNNIRHALIIFPNPAKSEININVAEGISELELFNTFGKLVYCRRNINDTRVKLELNDFKKGIYYCRIKTEDGKTESEKIIITDN